MRLYTDGSCKKGKGGWAFVLLEDDGSRIVAQSSSVSNTTNNRMELLALIEGLKEASKNEGNKLFRCRVYTDSAYCLNCYKEGWYKIWKKNQWVNSRKEPVKNRDLWEELIPFFDKSQYEFLKVTGHSGDYFNEMVDSMAQAAADSLKKEN